MHQTARLAALVTILASGAACATGAAASKSPPESQPAEAEASPAPRTARSAILACNTGDAARCVDVAEGFRKGDVLPRDLWQAFRFYSFSCTDAHPAGCEAAQRAAAELTALCRKGDGESCVGVARALATGRGVKLDQPAAAELNELGCKHGHPLACLTLSDMLSGGVGLTADIDRAAAMKQRGLELGGEACKAGHANLCWVHAQNLMTHAVLARNPIVEARVLARACELEQLDACAELGASMIRGRPAKKNVARGMQLLEAACDANHYMACSRLGSVYAAGIDTPPDRKRAFALSNKACELGEENACAWLERQKAIEAESKGGSPPRAQP